MKDFPTNVSLNANTSYPVLTSVPTNTGRPLEKVLCTRVIDIIILVVLFFFIVPNRINWKMQVAVDTLALLHTKVSPS